MDYYSLFWGPGVISTIDEPQGALTCRSSTHAVLAESGPLVDYYSLFWGPCVISILVIPNGPRTSTPPTVIVLTDSDPFRGVLLPVLESWSDY